jgi:hypothetical protein
MGVKVEPHVLLEDSAKMLVQRPLRGSIDLNEEHIFMPDLCFGGEMWNEKSIGKSPNAVSATKRFKKNLGDLWSPTAPPASHRNGADESCGSHTTVTLCSQFVFRGTDRRIGHREQLIVCQLRFTLPSESRLVRAEVDTVEFSIPSEAKRVSSRVSTAAQT